jgi:hypothetical protein
MARLDAPRNARNGRDTQPRSGKAEKEEPSGTPSKGWPFAEGSQNHLDETAAPWPRPSARPGSGWPERNK